MVLVGFAEGKNGLWRYIDRDLIGGVMLRQEPYERSQQLGQKLQKWVWQQGEQKWERLVANEVSASAPTTDGSSSFSESFPPEGGLGRRGVAKFSWFSDAKDELSFPKDAEIREIEDVNGDWYWGTYMGAKGVFPGEYVRLRPEGQ